VSLEHIVGTVCYVLAVLMFSAAALVGLWAIIDSGRHPK
jgi:hypothetical protein